MNIKELNIGDEIKWIDGAGFEQKREVVAADDGAKSVRCFGKLYPVKNLLNVNDTVEKVDKGKCPCREDH